MGIPYCNNTGSKNLEIPRNSKLIANRTLNSQEFPGIPTQSTNDFPEKAVNLKNLPEIPWNFQEFLGMSKYYWEF